jgi:hypothetical protein
MLSCKKISVLLFLIIVLPSCMEQKILFDFQKDVNVNFFKEIPGIGSDVYLNQPVTKKAGKLDIYLSSFTEKYIEKDNLLEFTELNDSTTLPYVSYLGVEGYSQGLYLLKYEFEYSVKNKSGKPFQVPVIAAIFFVVKHNGQGNTTGVTPCYFGIVNTEDNVIAFDSELSLKKEDNLYFLNPKRKKKNYHGMLFIPREILAFHQSSIINIKKIVRLDPNKVGGYKPLVFDVSKIFHDQNALQFHYISTLQLKQ